MTKEHNDQLERPMMENRDGPQLHEHPTPPSPTAGPADDARARHYALLIVFLVVFIDLLGFGIVLPLLPLYANELLSPLLPGNDQGGLMGILLGLLMSSFSLMQFFFAPLWGRVSDRIGRRPILLLGLAASVVFYSLFGVASELGAQGDKLLGVILLFVARLGAGVAGATIGTAQAVIADCTPVEQRSRGMALIGMAFGIGFTFGPLLGFASLFLNRSGAPGFMAATLSLIALLLGLWLMPETLRTGSMAGRRRWLDWRGLVNALRTPTVGILIVTFFLATFAFGGLESTLALANKVLLNKDVHVELTREAAMTTERNNFLVFAYVGFVLMLAQGLFYRRLVRRIGEIHFMRIGIVLMGLGLGGGMAVLVFREELGSGGTLLAVALLVMTVAVLGFACLTPSVQALISLRSDPAKQGEILGVNQSASALARILGPMVSLWLFFKEPSHILPYAFGSGLLLIVLLLNLRIHQD